MTPNHLGGLARRQKAADIEGKKEKKGKRWQTGGWPGTHIVSVGRKTDDKIHNGMDD